MGQCRVMVHLLYSKIENNWDSDTFANYLDLMPECFAQKISHYRYPKERQARITGRLLLMQGIQRLGCGLKLTDIQFSSYEKPFFPECNIRFSIAHSHHTVVCAISDEAEIGIDTEDATAFRMADYATLIPQSMYNDIMAQPDRDKAFLYYWTSLEATLKGEGTGLLIPARDVFVDSHWARVRSRTWHLQSFCLNENNITTIASLKPIGQYHQREVLL